MDKRTTLEVIAPTVEEAIAQGLEQLGLPAQAVSVEVLDTGSKGLFGLGGRQVRVRLTVVPPGGMPVPVEKPASQAPGKSKSKVKPVPAPKAGSKPKAKAGPKTKPESDPKPDSKPAQKAETAPGVGTERILDLAEDIVSKLLFHLGLQAQVSAHNGGDDRDGRQPVYVDIRGDDLSVLIGRRAETLNAFQYLVGLMLSKEMEQWVHVVVDVEGYRERRERQLQQMARRMAEQVLKTGRRQVLEPMPASERRIVHLELREFPDLVSESIGEEPNRKVTIKLKEE
jgi:spoIIIJ-associated protein